MYERFTDRARKVMRLANQEAKRLNGEDIGTEHILLGLVMEGSGVAANVLKNLDVDLPKVRLAVEKLVQSGPDMVSKGKLPQTTLAKRSARRCSNSWVMALNPSIQARYAQPALPTLGPNGARPPSPSGNG